MLLHDRAHRLDPALCRCCWYVIVAVTFALAALTFMNHRLQHLSAEKLLSAWVVLGSLIVMMLVALRWRLKVLRDGLVSMSPIHRVTWTWNDFGSGRIRNVYLHTWLDPLRPSWCRCLRLGFLDAQDRSAVLSAIHAHYVPPIVIALNHMTIRVGWATRYELDERGVKLVGRNFSSLHTWSDVRSLLFQRMDEYRQDFQHLCLTFDDHEIELRVFVRHGQAMPTWRGASAEEISQFLLRHVDATKVETVLCDELPIKAEHVAKQLDETCRHLRCVQVVGVGVLALAIFALVSIAVTDGYLKATVMGLFIALNPGCVFWLSHASLRKRTGRLRDRLALLKASDAQEEIRVDGTRAGSG